MDFKNINMDDIPEDSFNITNHIIAQIVAEQDDATMKMIEQYVKKKQAEGELCTSAIIPEGKLRHIINLGLTRYENLEHYRFKTRRFISARTIH